MAGRKKAEPLVIGESPRDPYVWPGLFLQCMEAVVEIVLCFLLPVDGFVKFRRKLPHAIQNALTALHQSKQLYIIIHVPGEWEMRNEGKMNELAIIAKPVQTSLRVLRL